MKFAIQCIALAAIIFLYALVFAENKVPLISVPSEIYKNEERNITKAARLKKEVIKSDWLVNETLLISLPSPTPQELPQKQSLSKQSQQIGFSRKVFELSTASRMANSIIWRKLSTGGQAATLVISSPEALALKAGISVREIPTEVEIRFFEAGINNIDGNVKFVTGKQILELIQLNREKDASNSGADTYWSPTINGDSIGIEFFLPDGISTSEIQVSIPAVSHIYKNMFLDIPYTNYPGDSLYCQNDSTCYPSWDSSIRSVAAMRYVKAGNTYYCTGTLLNDTDTSTFIPYFITANHCISSQTVSSTLETGWYWESDQCNSNVINPNFKVLENGAVLLKTLGRNHSSSSMDISLLKLRDSLPHGVVFAGWTTTLPSRGRSLTGVHHPSFDWKKISFGFRGATYNCDPNINCTTSTSGNFVDILWSEGNTEGGSSGSGIFNTSHQLIGILSAGWGSCYLSGAHDWYSIFGKAYVLGDLSKWLNPQSISEPAPSLENKGMPWLSLLLFGNIDCNGDKKGTAYIDNCSICVGGNTGLTACPQDCSGIWGGTATTDNCGTCDTNPSNDCTQDCAGTWGGSATTDNCGTCDTNPSNDCTQDCAGTWGGSATTDNCGTCDTNPSNDCTQDCAGTWGGTATTDNCGTCDSNPSNDCVQDCAGTWGGIATTDECGVCDTDPKNDNATCTRDCNGEWDGTAYLNNINLCVGGNTGLPAFETVTSLTGKVWMDRNLGASRVATSSTDSEAYGDLYQWGRLTDGHEKRLSGTTTTVSTTDVPGHGDYISVPPPGGGTYADWRVPSNSGLWQGVSGTSNPCPAGFRLPTDAEWTAEVATWGSNNNAAGAYASPLKLVVAGNRGAGAGVTGWYWSSSVMNANYTSYHLFFKDNSAYAGTTNVRASAYSVRCIQDSATTLDCNGEIDGTAYVDNCDVCVGGSTGRTGCTQDCNSVWGGAATLDECGVCDTDPNNDNTTCTQDCNGEWGGTAYQNNCQTCVGGSTGISPFNCITSSTGKVWMDRNLGATQVATSVTDSAAYGDLYQWGRLTDGHEKRTSSTTKTLSSSATPGHNKFIREDGTGTNTYSNWMTEPDETLWQGMSGTNNPCPAGFRLPTYTEWSNEGISSASDAFEKLKLVMAGYRNFASASFSEQNIRGRYWSSGVFGAYEKSYHILFDSSAALIDGSYRGPGLSVRCIQN